MTKWSSRIACTLFAVVAASAAHAGPARKSEAVIVIAKDIKWGEAPPDLPKGAQLAVLYGDPGKSGQYAVRLKMPDGYAIPPHWHTRDEQLTILSGTLVLHMGDTMTAEAHELGAGDYHFLPGKMHHAAEAKGETVVQIHGAGPFDIRYVNRADNPNPKSARK